MSSESAFTKRLRKKLPHVIFTRHEDALSEGIPDMSYCYAGVNGWAEMKQVDEWWPSRGMIRTPFRPSQTLWMQRRMGVAGPMLGICQAGDTPEVCVLGPAAIVWLGLSEPVPTLTLFARRADVRLLDMRDPGFVDKITLLLKNGLPP